MSDRGDIILGRKLKELRKAKRLSQAEVAAAVGVTRGHISALETGKRPVGRETLMALAELFGTSLDFIASRLGEEGAANAKNELEAAVLMITRELPADEMDAWVKLMLTRLRGKLHNS